METFRIVVIVMHMQGVTYVSDPYQTMEACESAMWPFVAKTQHDRPGMEFVSRCGPSSSVQRAYERGERIEILRPTS